MRGAEDRSDYLNRTLAEAACWQNSACTGIYDSSCGDAQSAATPDLHAYRYVGGSTGWGNWFQLNSKGYKQLLLGSTSTCTIYIKPPKASIPDAFVVTCHAKKHCVFLHGAGVAPQRNDNIDPTVGEDPTCGGLFPSETDPTIKCRNKLDPTAQPHPYYSTSPATFNEEVTHDGGPAGDRYWGDVHLHTPQCATRTFIFENTLTRSWDNATLQQAYCNAAASRGSKRDTGLLKGTDGKPITEFLGAILSTGKPATGTDGKPITDGTKKPVPADYIPLIIRNALIVATAIAQRPEVSPTLVNMIAKAQRSSTGAAWPDWMVASAAAQGTKWLAAQYPEADVEITWNDGVGTKDKDLSDHEFGMLVAGMAKKDATIAAALKLVLGIELLSNTIEDTIVFTHSMANNILASALAKGVCSFGKGGSWYSVAGPMEGAAGIVQVVNLCKSERARKWAGRLAPGNLVKGLCDGSKPRETWLSLMTTYKPDLLRQAAATMRDEPALKGLMCGTSGYGQGVGTAMGLRKMGCFFTRKTRDGTQPDVTDLNPLVFNGVPAGDYFQYCALPWPNDFKSLAFNDGAVTLTSCLAARKDTWENATSWQGKQTWKTEQNHEDVTCRLGNWKRACSWYGLAE